MSGKPRVDRTPEEKWQIVQEGMKSGNVSETCRRHGIAPTRFYRWKEEAEQGAKAALGGRSAAAAETEKDRRIRQLERTLGRKSLETKILKNVVGSELRRGTLPGARNGERGLRGDVGCSDARDQPVQLVLPKQSTRQQA
jgi:transposase-like protein